MKKILYSIATVAALGMVSCSKSSDATDANTLVSNDFETLAGWLPDVPKSATLTREKAHSGHYSLKVDAAHEYSLGFSAVLGQLHETRINKIKVSAWVFLPAADAQAALVTAVTDPAAPDKPLLWESLDLSLGKKVGKWAQVSKVITLPATTAPTNALGLYLWRTSGNQPVYLDDLVVTVEP